MIKLFVNARFLTQPLSGVQRYGIECSRQIKKLYPNATFLAPKNIQHQDIAAELDVKITGKNTGHLWEQADLPAYLSKNGNPPLLNLANTAPINYKNNYITIHDLAFYHHPEWNSKLFSIWYNFLVPRLVRKSKHVFTVSNTIRDEIVKYYHANPAKISVTYNGISTDMASKNGENCIRKEKIVLSVGSFNLRKNHQNLVKAFLESDLKEDYRLVVIGDKNKVFSESGVDEAGIKNDHIDVRSRLSDDELVAMYCKSEIVVSLSLYEGFGIPLLEGLNFGCKVLCSDIPVYRELYDKYAYFCDPHNIKDIKEKLNEISINNHVMGDVPSLLKKYNYERSARVIIEQILSETSHIA